MNKKYSSRYIKKNVIGCREAGGLGRTCVEMPVSRPLRPDSRDPIMRIKVLVSRFSTKAIWLLNKTSRKAKYAFVTCQTK